MRALFALALAAFLVTGCGAATADGGPSPTPTPTDDERIFLAMLAGEVAVADGFAQISASGGWPIDTPSGFLFAVPDASDGPWKLAGDFDEWTPEEMTLENGVWWIRRVISFPNGSKYKLEDGAAVLSADPWSRRYTHDENGEASLVAETDAHFQRFFDVGDAAVSGRTIRVRVPALTPTHHLYVHDGQNLFGPDAPFGGWNLEDTLGAATLGIGIDNSPARMDEYTHVPDDIGSGEVGGAGDDYADYVQNTVRPLVEAKFGTPSRTGTMGSSLGGLIALHIAMRHDGAWDYAASLSGTMGWGSIGAGVTNETMIERHVAAGHLGTKLYLDSGGDAGSGCVDADADGTNDDTPDASDNYCENRQLADTLDAIGYTYDADLWHWHEPGAGHNEAAWAARVFRPVQIFEAL